MSTFVTRPDLNLPMTRLSDEISAMNTSSTGSTRPLINWAMSMTPMRSMFGMSTITAENAMTNVKMLLNSGASFHLKDTPASQPNASQMTNAVVSGSTHAAKNDAAIRPMANRASAYLPANGASAAAASAASLMTIPCGYSTVPVVTMMNHATKQAATVPETTSTFCVNSSSGLMPFSTTLLWLKNIIQGAMVVPIMDMTSETKLCWYTTWGTMVLIAASSQFGCAKNAAIT